MYIYKSYVITTNEGSVESILTCCT